MAQYAKYQPQGFKNHVENIAIVGAGGRVGEYVAKELLNTGKHRVMALSRAESTSQFADGISVKRVNYDSHDSLVDALRGQDVLIITMAVTAPRDQEAKLIKAAADAGVPWVMPNEYGADPSDKLCAKESFIGEAKEAARQLIADAGKSAYIALICNFWYEFSLAGYEERFGFDFKSRAVTFYDQGTTKINTSTFEQCGRAVASVLSLKILPEDASDKTPTMSHFRNQCLYISSFKLSQRDMLDSVLRVTGTTGKDWAIRHQDVKERYKQGVDEMNRGKMMGFAKAMYARVFYPDGCGNYEDRRGLDNDLLGLPQEDLDTQTKIAVKWAEDDNPVLGGRL